MIKARLHRMASGHIVATFKDGDTVTYTRVVGKPSDKFGPIAQWVKKNFSCDQVGIRASDLGPYCVNRYGSTVWLDPSF